MENDTFIRWKIILYSVHLLAQTILIENANEIHTNEASILSFS